MVACARSVAIGIVLLAATAGSVHAAAPAETAADAAARRDPERIQSTQIYPTLEERKLGTPYVDEEAVPAQWNRPLPFLAQRVLDLGFDLPNPFGIAIIPTWIRQDLELQDLAVGINGSELQDIDFITFGRPQAENMSLQLKFDAWIFPFMNLFATVGAQRGEGTIPLSFRGDDLLPDLCDGVLRPPQCLQTFSGTAEPEYDGRNLSLGINLATGWRRYFFTLPITHAWTDVDITNETVTAWNISPRFGFTGQMKDRSTIAVYLGTTWLKAEVDLAGTLPLTIPGDDPRTVLVEYRLDQRNRDPFNYLLGFNWDLDKHLSLQAEAGVGGTRQNFISSLTYRF